MYELSGSNLQLIEKENIKESKMFILLFVFFFAKYKDYESFCADYIIQNKKCYNQFIREKKSHLCSLINTRKDIKLKLSDSKCQGTLKRVLANYYFPIYSKLLTFLNEKKKLNISKKILNSTNRIISQHNLCCVLFVHTHVASHVVFNFDS